MTLSWDWEISTATLKIRYAEGDKHVDKLIYNFILGH